MDKHGTEDGGEGHRAVDSSTRQGIKCKK